MSDVQGHYERLLAEHYTWMFGGVYEDRVREQRDLLLSLGLAHDSKGAAIDLGAGSGFQTVALADLGFSPVVAIDTSETLLRELQTHAVDRPIRSERTDIVEFTALNLPPEVTVVVCMGDTLPHLNSADQVQKLIADVYRTLEVNGKFIITFRDQSTALTGIDRFIPIRADADRIMTCALEYEDEHVIVTDLVHVRVGETWSLCKSSYRKLRMSTANVTERLRTAGFEVVSVMPGGRMSGIVAVK